MFNSCAAISNIEEVCCSSSLSSLNVYLAIGSGGYLCTNNLHTFSCSMAENSRWCRPNATFSKFILCFGELGSKIPGGVLLCLDCECMTYFWDTDMM